MISSIYLYISWDIDPALYDGFIALRYYSLFFAISFLLGFTIVKKMFANEKAPIEWMDKLLMYSVIGTILGARLGHVFFYDLDYYLDNLAEIFMVWRGGLASHGAAIALIIAMWIFSKKITQKHTLWSLDKLVIAAALAAGFIRVGNLMNSEIVGLKTSSDLSLFYKYKAKNKIGGFFNINSEEINFETTEFDTTINNISFPKILTKIPLGSNKMSALYSEAFSNAFGYDNLESDADFFSSKNKNDFFVSESNQLVIPIFVIRRIPTQIYEAICYWFIFWFLFWGYWRKQWYLYQGRLFGIFLTLLFASRFFVEFYKEHQAFSNDSFFTMGQYLSIPLVIIGLFFWIKSTKIDTH